MKLKRKLLVVVLSVLFLLSSALTVSFAVQYVEAENRPIQEATRQAQQVATQMANFYLTATAQPSATPSPTPTRLPSVAGQKLLIPTATKLPTSTPNPHAAELQQALSQVDIDFAAWQSINPAVQAWIRNDSIRVDLPVVLPPDNEHYLTRDIDLSYKAMGSIFFDFRNKTDFTDRNTIIYGHNFDNGLMFSNLVWYKDQHFFEQNPYYYLYTPEQVYRVDIAAGIVVSETDITYLDVDFRSDMEFRSLIQEINQNSLIESEIELSPRDKLVTLYTCTNDWQGQRFVVIGKVTPLGVFPMN
ncbi:MAG: class B sortase [Anaerolineaceae bacterium]|jgi:sortase B|nr:class B sortase [Anaerolineaceae bacterium]MDD4042567.1 class B sortase [Anaerolineaceae bacterium]MDD4577758.1 class B sortase [Anaerolineaceae bacterium]